MWREFPSHVYDLKADLEYMLVDNILVAVNCKEEIGKRGGSDL